jgi:UDP-N-acetylglucosamine diphosphorylase / glucose-1-phosphate thymidylyltransferase / UDP-N-acetylgalactosamine diphosphorylase / glucosamine-1-phosphate N-acetyltransferase / galactosamine-1-phosphate N-acetyltransferase
MTILKIENYIQRFAGIFPVALTPWEMTKDIQSLLVKMIASLDSSYSIKNDVAIHHTANIEHHVILKGPIVIGPGCFIGSHAYLRGGVFIDEKVSIGPGCEVKSSFLFANASLAHFNFVGDSVVGSNVNMEAGSIVANHYNEREDKTIRVLVSGEQHTIDSTKFGALIGDGTKIGANAVLSPGTILPKKSIVKRLELISQCE